MYIPRDFEGTAIPALGQDYVIIHPGSGHAPKTGAPVPALNAIFGPGAVAVLVVVNLVAPTVVNFNGEVFNGFNGQVVFGGALEIIKGFIEIIFTRGKYIGQGGISVWELGGIHNHKIRFPQGI